MFSLFASLPFFPAVSYSAELAKLVNPQTGQASISNVDQFHLNINDFGQLHIFNEIDRLVQF